MISRLLLCSILLVLSFVSCQQKVHIEPAKVPAEFRKAEQHFYEQNFSKALKQYREFVNNNPYNIYSDDAYFKMGYIYTEQGNYQQASEAFNTVIEDYPRSQWQYDAKVIKKLVDEIMALRRRENRSSCSDEVKEFRKENERLRQRIEELQRIIGDM